MVLQILPHMQKSNPLKISFGFFVIYRAFIFLISFFSITFFPKLIAGDLIAPGTIFNYMSSWANWDGGHYLAIAKDGYQIWFQYAFFPLYPILIKLFSIFTSPLISGLVISNLSLFLAIYFFYKLVRLDFSQQTAIKTITYFLVFPTSFFLVALYSESLFLFLTIASFYFARQKNYLYSNILAGFAVLTRPIGILILAGITFEYFYQRNFKFKKVKIDLILFLLPILFLLVFLYFLKSTYGDPFIFIKAQTFWQRGVNSFPIKVIFDNLYQVASLKNLGVSIYSNQLLDLTAFLIAFIGLIFSLGKIRLSYLIYALLVILVPLVSGSIASMSRFVLVAFPVFVYFAILGKNEMLDRFLLMVFIALQAILLTLFLNGFWVA